MQTNEQLLAGKDVDADPNRSLDAQVAAMLKARGLRFNPFRLTHSEGDAYLPAMLVRTPMTPHGSGARHFVYGEAGSGKTAKMLRYLVGINAYYPQRRVLAIPFRASVSGNAETVFAPALAQAFTAALFTTALVHAPEYDLALADRLARAFDLYLDIPNWRNLIASANQPDGVALMYDLVDMPRLPQAVTLPAAWRTLATWPMTGAERAPVDDTTLAELIDLALAMGARKCVVLADDLNTPGRDAKSVADWAARLWDVRQLHGCVEVQMYLPLAARETVEQALGTQEAEIIQWDVAALRALLAQRLHVAGASPMVTVATLLGFSAETDDEMMCEAAGSPRRLIALIRNVLEAQAEQRAAELRPPSRKTELLHSHVVNHANAGVFHTAPESPEPPARPIPTPLLLVAARMANRLG